MLWHHLVAEARTYHTHPMNSVVKTVRFVVLCWWQLGLSSMRFHTHHQLLASYRYFRHRLGRWKSVPDGWRGNGQNESTNGSAGVPPADYRQYMVMARQKVGSALSVGACWKVHRVLPHRTLGSVSAEEASTGLQQSSCSWGTNGNVQLNPRR